MIQRKVTASRWTKAALPICDTCGASGGNRRAVKPTLITSGSRRTEMLQLRLMEKKRELLRREDFDEPSTVLPGSFPRI